LASCMGLPLLRSKDPQDDSFLVKPQRRS